MIMEQIILKSRRLDVCLKVGLVDVRLDVCLKVGLVDVVRLQGVGGLSVPRLDLITRTLERQLMQLQDHPFTNRKLGV